MEEDFKELEEDAEILKALAHPVRLCIVKASGAEAAAMYPTCSTAFRSPSRHCPSICRS